MSEEVEESTADARRTPGVEPRLLTLEDAAVVLNVSVAQVYALVRSGRLPALKLGGRGIWRVDKGRLDGFIEEMHEKTAREVGRDRAAPAESP